MVLDPDPNNQSMTSSIDLRDSFVIKLGNSQLHVEEPNHLVTSLVVYPNPVTDLIYIKSLVNIINEDVVLYDVLGKVVYKNSYHSDRCIWNQKPVVFVLQNMDPYSCIINRKVLKDQMAENREYYKKALYILTHIFKRLLLGVYALQRII